MVLHGQGLCDLDLKIIVYDANDKKVAKLKGHLDINTSYDFNFNENQKLTVAGSFSANSFSSVFKYLYLYIHFL